MNRRFLVLLALLLAIGCRREAPAARASAQATPAAQQPQDGGTLVRRLASDVNTLNMLHIGSDPERQVLALVHDPLIAIDAQLRFVPGLAEKWEISPDGKVYTFFIDKRANEAQKALDARFATPESQRDELLKFAKALLRAYRDVPKCMDLAGTYDDLEHVVKEVERRR